MTLAAPANCKIKIKVYYEVAIFGSKNTIF
jgi:hypothetical protein